MKNSIQAQNSNLTVVLPAYNEEKSIGMVIDEIRSLPVQVDILVVDNASIDETYNIAVYKKVKVITEPFKGKGNTIRGGFGLVKTPYVVMMNSDYTYPAKYIMMVYGLLSVGYDAIVGYREGREQGSMSLLNSFGNKMLSLLASILYRKRVLDVCCGLWGFRKDILDKFYLDSKGFTLEAELFTQVVKHKCKMAQVPIGYRSRPQGSRAKLKVWDGFKIGWFLIKSRFK